MKVYCPRSTLLLLFLFLSVPMRGTGQVHPGMVHSLKLPSFNDTPAPGTLKKREITTSLLYQEEYQSIVKNIPVLRKNLGKIIRPSAAIGTLHTFFVRRALQQTMWDKVTARLIYRDTGYAVWLDTSAEETLLDSQDVHIILDSLHYSLKEQTSSFSVDPNTGILPILHEYFGDPPDIDGDGMLDILLLDIPDAFESTGSYVAGFFDPNDLSDNQYSNRRDMLYIDIYPTITYENELTVHNATATIAHETQHLIHANYEGPEREYIFINEGLSELAEIVCGFPPRPAADYFSIPRRPLLIWNFDNPLPDYARASLWMHYLFEQLGYQWIPALEQSAGIGLTGIQQVLDQASSVDFQTIFQNWSIALSVNDRSLDPAFGYAHPLRRELPGTGVMPAVQLPRLSREVLPDLSCQFVDVPLVKNLFLECEEKSDVLQVTAIQRSPDGQDRVLPSRFLRSALHYSHTDRYGAFRLVFANMTPQNSEQDSAVVTNSVLLHEERSGLEQTLKYDDGVADPFSGIASYLQLTGTTQAVGCVFAPEPDSWISGLSVKTLFSNEIQGTAFSPGRKEISPCNSCE